MKETYVTIKQAQALKRLGFDWECDHYYAIGEHDWYLFRTVGGIPANFNKDIDAFPIDCSAPALHVAAKWLREAKGIAVNVPAHDGGLYDWEIVLLPNAAEDLEVRNRSTWCKTYEEALSEGIDEALEDLERRAA